MDNEVKLKDLIKSEYGCKYCKRNLGNTNTQCSYELKHKCSPNTLDCWEAHRNRVLSHLR